MTRLLQISLLAATLISDVSFAQIGVPKLEKPPEVKGPTLEETLTWITTKLSGPWAPAIYSGMQYRVAFNGCAGTESLMPVDSVKGFSLTELDPSGARMEDSTGGAIDLSIPTLSRKSTLRRHFRYGNGTYGDQWSSSLELRLPSAEAAESTLNAFKHAVQLCNQKAASDKSAAPRPKELF